VTDTIATERPAGSARFGDRLVAEIAASLPGATAVFRRHKLDFCCGGKQPLAEAVAAKGIPLDRVEADLAALAAPDLAVPPAATGALIQLIVERYHETHRRELPELLRLAKRVEAVHGEHPAAPRGVAALLQEMAAELESHMRKEEQILFPMMLRGGHPQVGQPITMMRHEHDDHGEHLRQLEALTGNFIIPAGACPTWQALYAGLRKLTDDLMEHIHLENNVLFPRFEG
jgi:regulator of cell morphogenesis and NO signaling